MLPIATIREQLKKHFSYTEEKIDRIIDYYINSEKLKELSTFVDTLMSISDWRKTV